MASIVPYHGEFLINPVPLEMSLGMCSHGCQYCFATAKPQGDRETQKQVESTIRWLATYHDKHSLEAQLLQKGYPVVVSNRADPFSRAGESAILPIAEIMRDMQIPMMIQTKGGRKALDFAKTLPKSAFYISISFDESHTKLCRQMEPGAPTPRERLDMVKALKKMGHVVHIGWNPCVAEWVDDPMAFAKELKATGCDGVWLEALHMSRLRITSLDSKATKLLGEELISAAMDKKGRPLFPFVQTAKQCCRLAGLEVFSGTQSEASNYWKPVQAIYEHTYPIWQDAINHLHKINPKEPIESSFFVEGFARKMPELTERAECGHILTSQKWTLGNEPWYSNKMTMRQVIEFGMNDARSAFHPTKQWALAHAAQINENGENEGFYVDDNGKKMFLFVKAGKKFDTYSPE